MKSTVHRDVIMARVYERTFLLRVEQVLAQVAAEHALAHDAAAFELRARRSRREEAAQEGDQLAALAHH